MRKAALVDQRAGDLDVDVLVAPQDSRKLARRRVQGSIVVSSDRVAFEASRQKKEKGHAPVARFEPISRRCSVRGLRSERVQHVYRHYGLRPIDRLPQVPHVLVGLEESPRQSRAGYESAR
jgi:hypothetical protein